jgi:hypothetical protein
MAKHSVAKAPVPVEHKVVWSTLASAAVSIVLAVLNGLSTNPGALESTGLPKEYQTLVLGLIPPLVVFLCGYKAQHTTRPDVAAQAEAPSPDTVAGADAEPVMGEGHAGDSLA